MQLPLSPGFQKEADRTWLDKDRSCFLHTHTHTLNTPTYLCMHTYMLTPIHVYAQTCVHTHKDMHITCTHSDTHVPCLIFGSP